MPSHAELAAKLLTDAAGFFRTVAAQNSNIQTQMIENADVFERIAALLMQNPGGDLNGRSHADLAASLLKDAANFFRTLGEQNPPLKEQMTENAGIFDQIAGLLLSDPLGRLE